MTRIMMTFVLALLISSGWSQTKPYVFVFLNKKADAEKITKEESDRIMKGHMDNITRLANEDKLIAAGPFEGGGGIFVLNTASVDEANKWLSTDPGVQAKRWNIDVLPFHMREGGICHAKEPYQMVTYNLIRYRATVTKETAQDFPQIIQKHDEYLKTIIKQGNVLIEGTFGDNEGGVMILKGEITDELMLDDPGVQESLVEAEVKKLWIAKGSFCEK